MTTSALLAPLCCRASSDEGSVPLQLRKAHESTAMAELEIRAAVAAETEELLREMENNYRVCTVSFT